MQKSWLAAQVSAFNSTVTGFVDKGASYLQLKQTNEKLLAQNKDLMNLVYGKDAKNIPMFRKVHDTIGGGQIFTFVSGEIVYNSINRKDNYFTINRGKRDGVYPKMGVMAPNGIAGIVINATDGYALVQSVLSVNKIKINAALKNSGYFGTLTWNGENSRIMHLNEIPKYVALKVGDTVQTDGKSSIFPQGKTIGTISGYKVDSKTGYWDISVELSEKMGTLSTIYVVKNLKKAEVERIQDSMQVTIDRE